MKKSSVAWLFAVVILSFLLVLSVILGLTGYYFSVSYLNSASDLVVGEGFSVGVKANQSSVVSFTFDGGYLPNEIIPQTIQIVSQDLSSDVWVRVKSKVFGVEGEVSFDFITTEHFEKANDGYYYFDDILKGGNKITFCSYVVIPKQVDMSSEDKYILTVVVETLENGLDSENIWKNVQ